MSPTRPEFVDLRDHGLRSHSAAIRARAGARGAVRPLLVPAGLGLCVTAYRARHASAAEWGLITVTLTVILGAYAVTGAVFGAGYPARRSWRAAARCGFLAALAGSTFFTSVALALLVPTLPEPRGPVVAGVLAATAAAVILGGLVLTLVARLLWQSRAV